MNSVLAIYYLDEKKKEQVESMLKNSAFRK